jgi:hypothetical protein
VELFGEVVDAPFFIIADVLGHEYTALSGKQADSEEIDRDANFEVDIEELATTLDTII